MVSKYPVIEIRSSPNSPYQTFYSISNTLKKMTPPDLRAKKLLLRAMLTDNEIVKKIIAVPMDTIVHEAYWDASAAKRHFADLVTYFQSDFVQTIPELKNLFDSFVGGIRYRTTLERLYNIRLMPDVDYLILKDGTISSTPRCVSLFAAIVGKR